LRIGLRRLRIALALFRKALGNVAAASLAEEARWLG
jgi:CHAD domain-containing protein